MMYQILIWQEDVGNVMHFHMFETGTDKTVIHIRQGLNGPMTLKNIPNELRSAADWIDLQGKSK